MYIGNGLCKKENIAFLFFYLPLSICKENSSYVEVYCKPIYRINKSSYNVLAKQIPDQFVPLFISKQCISMHNYNSYLGQESVLFHKNL